MSRYEFTEEELGIAKGTDLPDLLTYFNYTVVKKGNYYSTKEIDSLRIYNRNTWARFSNNDGGTPIDFLIKVHNIEFKEAVKTLLSFNGNIISKDESSNLIKDCMKQDIKKDRVLSLPPKNENMARLYAYLIQSRNLSHETVKLLIDNDLVYESKDRHNVVFLSKDKEGVVRHASMRGTSTLAPFKGDVPGNDKSYGFNLVNEDSDILILTEATIDLLSYYELSNRKQYNYLSLGMCHDAPLERFLTDYPHVKHIKLGLDVDKAGNTSTEKMLLKYSRKEYQAKGITVEDIRLIDRFKKLGCKDWNEFLQGVKAVKKKKDKLR